MADIWLCIATGPSLRAEDIDAARRAGWKLATCNRGFQYAPDASVFVAHDPRWWLKYGPAAAETLRHDCELWTGSLRAVAAYGANRMRFTADTRPLQSGTIRWHDHSGGMLAQIVASKRPAYIVLTGYDCQHTDGRAHVHDDYPEGWGNCGNMSRALTQWRELASDFCAMGVQVLNATRSTALDCFPVVTMEELT